MTANCKDGSRSNKGSPRDMSLSLLPPPRTVADGGKTQSSYFLNNYCMFRAILYIACVRIVKLAPNGSNCITQIMYLYTYTRSYTYTLCTYTHTHPAQSPGQNYLGSSNKLWTEDGHVPCSVFLLLKAWYWTPEKCILLDDSLRTWVLSLSSMPG